MRAPFEQELQSLIIKFTVDIRLAVLRSLQTALEAVATLYVYRVLAGADTVPRTAAGDASPGISTTRRIEASHAEPLVLGAGAPA
jgi:hypothetical protein